MRKTLPVCLMVTLWTIGLCASCQTLRTKEGRERNLQAEKERRLAWFREARFGMFIHWGLYAVPAGEWKGQPVKGIGEWIMNRAKIPVSEYEQLAKRFNPVKFDADEWVRIAKNAGMKYIVITSKHHDGFAMFGSKVTPYNIVDATPFRRDPMKELAAACAKEGIKLCFYYSHAQDWHEPDAAGNQWDFKDESKKDFARYMKAKAMPQVKELLTNYGPIGLIWFDTPQKITAEQSKEFYDLVHKLQPDCLVNTRVGHGYGDYQAMGDNKISDKTLQEAWETPATMNNTWGYKKDDQNWKSTQQLIHNLVDIASKGGNYLLNVGPTAEGLIPQPSVERLAEVGQWMKLNGESIYGSVPSPFGKLAWGRCTTKPGRLYLHVFDWPADRRLVLPAIENAILKVYLLSDPARAALPVTRGEREFVIQVPAQAPDARDTVVVAEIEGAVKVDTAIRPQPSGEIVLKAIDATVHGKTVKYEDKGDGGNLGFWTNPKDWVSWEFKVETPGAYSVEITYAATAAGSSYEVAVESSKLDAVTRSTGGYQKYTAENLGAIEVTKAGVVEVSVKPLAFAKTALMNMKRIVLKPVK